MSRRFLMAFAAATLTLWAVRAAAQPRPAAAVEVGAEVRSADGDVLGRIEQVVADPAGQPQQVLVRTRGMGGVTAQVKSLPISSLRPDPRGYAVALKKSEFELLPALRNR